MLTISSGYDPGYLTRAVATGRENYYLSAVAEHGEPPGIWTGRGCPELGLPIGSEAGNKVMERLYGAFIDPRDPEGKATLGRAPSGFAGNNDKVAARIAELLAAEPEATQERRDQIIMQAIKEQRAAVYFFDATFFVPKSVSLLHASLQVRAQQARDAGRVDEAEQWAARAQTVWDAIMAANQAMLDYLQREAGYSRAGYHSKNSGRFADAHQWVIASFAQHTSRDNDPQLHVHNAIFNRVLREDPLASRPGDRRAWRTLDGAALYAAKPAAAAIAERTLAEYLSDRFPGLRRSAEHRRGPARPGPADRRHTGTSGRCQLYRPYSGNRRPGCRTAGARCRSRDGRTCCFAGEPHCGRSPGVGAAVSR
jgi:TrwC relaxase